MTRAAPAGEGRPLRVAVIGSGPAGFYAAEALLSAEGTPVEVDLFDRLPTPYGLVRGGVAPDHQGIKAVSRVFERTAGRDAFRFFGHTKLGRELGVDDLTAHYHQIVFAVGNEGDRRLGIPGEGMPRCTPGAVFVGWYNGHPDYRDATFDLSARRVAVVGNGNVAIDIARILAKSADELRRTDIAAHALAALAESRVETIIVLGRRGPLQASFTPAELKELGKLEDVTPWVDGRELQLDALDEEALRAGGRRGQRNLELLETFSRGDPSATARRIVFRFLVSPREVVAAEDGGVGALELTRNRLDDAQSAGRRAIPTGETLRLDVDMVLTAVGFAGQPIEGVPFDRERGVISNQGGRVTSFDGEVVPNHYVVGWARTGPKGLIGDHKKASAEVARAMLEDATRERVRERDLPPREALPALLRERGAAPVTFDDWRVIDRVERERGARRGAPRDKLTRVDELLGVVENER